MLSLLVPIALPSSGVNLLVGTENGLMLLDRSGQGKVYNLINRRRFQQMDVLEGLNVLVTISGMSYVLLPHCSPSHMYALSDPAQTKLALCCQGSSQGRLEVVYCRIKGVRSSRMPSRAVCFHCLPALLCPPLAGKGRCRRQADSPARWVGMA